MPLLEGNDKELNAKLSKSYDDLVSLMKMGGIGNSETVVMNLMTAADELHKSLLGKKQERIWGLEQALAEERKIWGTEVHKLADRVKELQQKLVAVQQGGGPIISNEMICSKSKKGGKMNGDSD
jgi:polyhydroxyalkanoate synthesis regulator phasin